MDTQSCSQRYDAYKDGEQPPWSYPEQGQQLLAEMTLPLHRSSTWTNRHTRVHAQLNDQQQRKEQQNNLVGGVNTAMVSGQMVYIPDCVNKIRHKSWKLHFFPTPWTQLKHTSCFVYLQIRCKKNMFLLWSTGLSPIITNFQTNRVWGGAVHLKKNSESVFFMGANCQVVEGVVMDSTHDMPTWAAHWHFYRLHVNRHTVFM